MIERERSRRKLAIAVLAMLGACRVTSAWGQEPRGATAQTANDKAQAERLAAEGRALFAKGNTQAAVDKLGAAWALDPSYAIAANLGTAELDLGRMRDAAEHLDFALREMPPATEKEKRERLAEYFKKAKAAVGLLRLDVDPPDALLSVDGTRIAKSVPAEIYVTPGEHTVTADREGRVKESQVVKLLAGETKPVALRLALQPVATSAPPVVQAPASAPSAAENRAPQVAIWLLGAGSTLALGVYMTASGAEVRGRANEQSAGDLLLGLGAAWMALGLGVGVGGILFERSQQAPATGVWIAPHATPRSAGITLGARY